MMRVERSLKGEVMSTTKEAIERTPTPWTVQKLNHANNEPWFQIGFFDKDGREIGPICEMVGGAVKIYRPVAEFHHLLASEAEIIANAEFIVRACNAYEANQETIKALVEALEPFAFDSPKLQHLPDDTPLYVNAGIDVFIALGDVRRARAALAKAEKGNQ